MAQPSLAPRQAARRCANRQVSQRLAGEAGRYAEPPGTPTDGTTSEQGKPAVCPVMTLLAEATEWYGEPPHSAGIARR